MACAPIQIVRYRSEHLRAYWASTDKLHPLAVEDVLHREQRPKLERYEDVTFLTVRAAQYVEHTALTETSEIVHTGVVWIFVGEHFVVTVRQGTVGELRSVRADLEAIPQLLSQGPWAVVHAVYDRVVDGYVDIATAMQTDGPGHRPRHRPRQRPRTHRRARHHGPTLDPCRLEHGSVGRYVLDRRVLERPNVDRVRMDRIVVGGQDVGNHGVGRLGVVGRRLVDAYLSHHRIQRTNLDGTQLDRT